MTRGRPWRRSDVSTTCDVCGNLVSEHIMWFKQPRDPHDALHDRIDFPHRFRVV